jgi:hypothetical protein
MQRKYQVGLRLYPNGIGNIVSVEAKSTVSSCSNVKIRLGAL